MWSEGLIFLSKLVLKAIEGLTQDSSVTIISG
jgi:hypothetical protein